MHEQNYKIDSYDESLELFKKRSSKENHAQPRFHKKRKPVPTRSVNSVTIYYEDGKQYTLKNVYAITLDKEDVTVYIKREITEGIIHSQSFNIETKLVSSVSCKSVSKENSFCACKDCGYWEVLRENSEVTALSIAQEL